MGKKSLKLRGKSVKLTRKQVSLTESRIREAESRSLKVERGGWEKDFCAVLFRNSEWEENFSRVTQYAQL